MGFNAWIQFTPTICLSGVEGVGKDHAESKAFTIPALKKTEAVASEAVLVWFRDVFFGILWRTSFVLKIYTI